jgi:capsular polysaccharide biosynthesis protein
VLAALAVLLVGTVLGVTRSSQWMASSQWLTGPSASGSNNGDLSAYYETLSRGQVTQTAAAIMGNQRIVDAAERSLGMRGDETSVVRVTVVPETALVKVTVIAADRLTAEQLANEVPSQAVPTIDRLLKPFTLQPVADSSGSAVSSGIGGLQFYAVLGAVALLVGAGTQQIVHQLASSRRRLRLQSSS